MSKLAALAMKEKLKVIIDRSSCANGSIEGGKGQKEGQEEGQEEIESVLSRVLSERR